MSIKLEATLWLLPVAGLHGHLQSGHSRGTNSTSSALLQDKWYTAPKHVESFSVPQKCIVQKQFSLINRCRCFIQLCCAKFQVWVIMPVILTHILSPGAIWPLNAFCCRGWSRFSSYDLLFVGQNIKFTTGSKERLLSDPKKQQCM